MADENDAAGLRRKAMGRRISNMFRRYAPEKLHKTADALEAYRGREAAFLRALVRKYGPEPTPEELASMSGVEDVEVPPPQEEGNNDTTPAIQSLVVQAAKAKSQQQVPLAQLTDRQLWGPQQAAARERIEGKEHEGRDVIDVEERLAMQRLVMKERSERRSAILEESRQQLNKNLKEGLQKMKEELDEAAEARRLADVTNAYNQKLKLVIEREMQTRVEIAHKEREAFRPIEFASVQSLSKVYKEAVRRQRAERKRRARKIEESTEMEAHQQLDEEKADKAADGQSSSPNSETAEESTKQQPKTEDSGSGDKDEASNARMLKFKKAQQRQVTAIRDRMKAREERIVREKEEAAIAEAKAKGFVKSVAERRTKRDTQATVELRAAVDEVRANELASNRHGAGISYAYLASAPRKVPQATSPAPKRPHRLEPLKPRAKSTPL